MRCSFRFVSTDTDVYYCVNAHSTTRPSLGRVMSSSGNRPVCVLYLSYDYATVGCVGLCLSFIISYHITELAMALLHQSSTAPYIRNTVIVIKVARLYVKS